LNMFIIICSQYFAPYEGGGAMVRNNVGHVSFF